MEEGTVVTPRETSAPARRPALYRRLLALPPRTRIVLAGALAATALGIVLAATAAREPQWRVLYAGLADKDGGAVIAALAQMNVPHRFTEGGGSIQVPAAQVHETRLRLAAQGLPKGGTVGFELTENQRFGTTQFQERLNFQRGLEGELARSIMALSAVQAARVHLALPQQTAFLREQLKPSASVLLTLHPGRTLERGQVAGIVHLVASSVPELQPRAVSIVDQSGTLLSQPPGESAAGAPDSLQVQYARQLEQSLSQRIVAILEPIAGAGNVRAQVTADIDFSQSESTAESYGPNQGGAPAAIRSQQLTESAPGGPGGVGGPPGTPSNQVPVQAPGTLTSGAPAGTSPSRREATTNYEVDRTVKVVRNAVGSVRRLSAAVVVNQPTAQEAGKAVARPLQPAQVEQIDALVREALGYSKERGDSVQVVHAPFTLPAREAPASVPFWREPETLELAARVAPWLLLPLALALLVFGVLRPALRPSGAGRLLDTQVGEALALAAPVAEGAVAAAQPSGGTALAPTPGSVPVVADEQTARQHARVQQLEGIREVARQNPATVANVVRNWINSAA